MSGFEDVVIEWKGKPVTIPANNCFGLLAALEEVLAPDNTQSAIEVLAKPHKQHLTKIARAYATALRFGGEQVTDEEVYLSLARGVQQGGMEGFTALKVLSDALLLVFFPDWARDEIKKSEGSEPKETEAETPTKTPLQEAS